MSDNDGLAEASWAAGLMGEKDWMDLQSKGQAIASGNEVFYLGIVKPVAETKALVEAYAAIALTDTPAMEHLETFNTFVHEVLMGFYSMCVEAGVLTQKFWESEQ